MSLINPPLEVIYCNNLASNYSLIRFIRFVSPFTDSSRNAFFISSRFQSPCRCRKKNLEFGIFTTTEQAFVSGHLSRLPLGPGQKVAFVPGPKASRASGGDRGLLSGLVPPTGTKGPCLPRWSGQPLDPGQKPHIVPGPKATGTNGLEQSPVLQQCTFLKKIGTNFTFF